MNFLVTCAGKLNRVGGTDGDQQNNLVKDKKPMTAPHMPRYTFPDLTGRNILYKGRRYIAFSVSLEERIEDGMGDYDFVIYDGLYDAVSAFGRRDSVGVHGELAFSSVQVEIETTVTVREFVKAAAKEQEQYHRDCGF